MAREQHRHDISDKAWEKIRPYTIGEKGTRGGNARDTRQYQRRILDSAYRSALAGLAGSVWELEECTPPFLPVA